MLKSNEFNVDIFKNNVEKKLNSSGVKFVTKSNSRGVVYVIKADKSVLEITLGPKWLGYDLTINDKVLGKTIGTFVDTDLYPLDFDVGVTQKIADETFLALESSIDNNIYVGKKNKKYFLAIPESKSLFRLEEKGRFNTKQSRITKDEILSKDFIFPIN